MSKDEVSSKETKFGNLAEEFTTRLGDGVPSHGVPLSSPPGDVGGVRLEFSSQCQSDDELVDKSLNGDDSDHTRQGSWEAEALKEHQHDEEDKKNDDGNGVGNGSKDSTKLLATHAEQGTRATCQSEHASQNTSVDTDRAQGDDANSDQGTSRLRVGKAGRLLGGIALVSDTGLGVDEQVRNKRDGNQDKRAENLTHEDVGEVSTRNIARQLSRWVSKNLALETSDTRTRETAVSDPGCAV